MSKRKHKDKCCCCCEPCCCEPCCCDPCCCDGGVNNDGIFGGGCCGIWQAILFWLIACGAGLLNTNSILIILLFLLFGWCGDGGNGCGDGYGM